MEEGEFKKRISENTVKVLHGEEPCMIWEILDEAKKEFPERAEFPYETCVEGVEAMFYIWFEKWFGEVKKSE